MFTYKAKTIDTNRWVYGYLVFQHGTGNWVIHEMCSFPPYTEVFIINYKTIGVITQLEDKNGNTIYTNDVLKVQLPLGGFWGNVKQEKTGVVVFEPERGGFIVQWEYSKNQHHINLDVDIAFEGEIIGNIHDNPEKFNYLKEE